MAWNDDGQYYTTTANDLKRAERAARGVLKRHPGSRVALYVLARVALRRRRVAEAVRRLNQLVAAGGDGYFARMQLGRLKLARRDLGGAVKHLERAKKFAPEMAEPYELLARAYGRAGKQAEQILELEQWSFRAQQKHTPVATLVELLAKRRDYLGLRRFGELASYIQPASARLHAWLAEAYEAPAPMPDLHRAIWHQETALLCKPSSPTALRRRLARLLKRAGQRP
jgi:predicted Zn-dependent protease